MTRVVSVLAIALAAVGTGCMGTRHASRGASPEAQAQTAPSQRQAGATAERGAGMGMADQCPMSVPGTQVAASDTPDGEAITFTTSSPEAVAELRTRVHAMADMHNEHHAAGQMGTSGGMHGEAGGPGMHGDMPAGGAGEGSAGSADAGGAPGADAGTSAGSSGSAADSGSSGSADSGAAGSHEHERMMHHASRAVVEDVDGGARVTVTPEDPSDLQRLQTAVRSHVERMNDTGSCEMGGRTMEPGDMQQPDLQPQGEAQKPQP